MTFKFNDSIKSKIIHKNSVLSFLSFSKVPARNKIKQKLYYEEEIYNNSSTESDENDYKYYDYSTPWVEDYGFPFYISTSKSKDALLVKDVGISCNLIKPEQQLMTSDSLTNSENEHLVNNRTHINGFPTLTRKLSAYTRNLFSNLSVKIIKSSSQARNIEISNSEEPDHVVMATEYYDSEGRPCLKLRCQSVSKPLSSDSKASLDSGIHERISKNRSKSIFRILFLQIREQKIKINFKNADN